MKRIPARSYLLIIALICGPLARCAVSQQPKAADDPQNDRHRAGQALIVQGDSETRPDAAQARAAYEKAVAEYRAAIRGIEQLRVDYQSADTATRAKINSELKDRVANAKKLVGAMVDTAVEVYRAEPNADPKIVELLSTVGQQYIIGHLSGPPEPASAPVDQRFFPLDAGDQYERALPMFMLLIDGGAAEKAEKPLYMWGFLSAFVTADYDLAAEYLAKAKASNAVQAISRAAQGDEPGAGVMRSVVTKMSTYAEMLEKHRELWSKESALRAAEAAANDLPRVKLTTTKGDITLELFENEAPQTVANFISLVKQGFYDGSPFHRVLPMFMAQAGAKYDEGQGGPGYRIRCECYRPDYRRHFRGSLSMAHAGRDTGNSQFFITFLPTDYLDGKHTVFGRVMEGLEVLSEIRRRSPAEQRSLPKADVILKAEVLRDRGHQYAFERLPE
jgi:cyclophilin family peptidyl-prolyl cis-trans isomerase